MQNGDRYYGHVLSLSADSVVLQNDNLGKITLARGKVSLLALGATALPAAAPVAQTVAPTIGAVTTPGSKPAVNPRSIVITNGHSDIAQALRSLGANTNFIEQIRGQFLADAGADANQQFSQTVAGLMTGQVNMQDLRTQAKSAADQLRAYQKQMGPEASDAFNAYLGILDNFLNETK
jgi:hypothetical protein